MPTLRAIIADFSTDSRAILDTIWLEYRTGSAWPTTWLIHSRLTKQRVMELVRGTSGSILYEAESSKGNTYQLTLLGILSTSDGPSLLRLLVRYVDHLRFCYKTNPEKQSITSEEVAAAIKLSSAESQLLGQMVYFGRLYSGSMSYGEKAWTAGILRQIEDCYDGVASGDFLEQLLVKDYSPDRPVLAEEARQQFSRGGAAFLNMPDIAPIMPLAVDVDPANRRYQVFVSSTYTDLVPERQEVLHSLLQTMCIPVGMELFPATGWEQLKLIKKIIDDSDYYILILAGRYGSRPAGSELSFTELEFDYAVEKKKHIICFPHKDPGQLKADFIEDTDEGKRRLAAFRKKAMADRTCAPWSNPHELGSHVKTAIMHAIREEPQPGWIRARSVAPVSERQFGKAPAVQISRTAESERLELPLRVSYHVVTDPTRKWATLLKRSEERLLHRTLDEVLLLLSKRLEQPANVSSLKRSLENRLESFVADEIGKQEPREIVRVQCSLRTATFQRFLDGLHASDLVTTKPAPRAAKDKSLHWVLTKTGAKRVSTLRAKS